MAQSFRTGACFIIMRKGRGIDMDLFASLFLQKALLAGLFLSVIMGFLSFFVVSKDLAFVGTGIAHITFGGLALGIFLNIDPMTTGILFAIFAGLGISFFSFEKKVSVNLAIGVFLAFSMAMGLILIKLSKSYSGDIFSYLFGSILAIDAFDLLLLGGIALLTLLSFSLFFKRFLLLIFDPAYGQTLKIPVRIYHTFLILILSIAIISMVKIVGTILVEGLLILPALSGYFLSKNYRQQLFYSFLFSFLSIFGGIFISASPLSLPSGPAIILTACLFLILGFIFRKRK